MSRATSSFCASRRLARYVNGYLGNIGVPPDPAPMDFNVWFETYLGGRWFTFDPRGHHSSLQSRDAPN
jgi:transglutaminase-like putative cysteine protease